MSMPIRLAATALGVALVLGCAARGDTESGPRPLAEVSFTLFQNGIIVPATIDGRHEVQLLLDTGWGPLALLSGSAERLGLAVDAPDGDGLARTHLRSIAVGGAVQNGPLAEVFPTETLVPLIGPNDGVLSTAFFRDLVLQIDYPARKVRFWRRSPLSTPAPSTVSRVSVPMVFSPNAGALPFTDSVFVDGKPVRGLFDTGGAGAFVATDRFVKRAGLKPSAGAGRASVGLLNADTTARQVVQFARVGRVSVGSFGVDSARVMLAPSLMVGEDWGHDLNIGYGFMRDYVVTFDYPGRVVTFEKPR